ncbi:MAG: hypothetical protein IPG68_13180 [Micrococcales bacterium]|nr:hypothetical protein [Micrococcales bacterium]
MGAPGRADLSRIIAQAFEPTLFADTPFQAELLMSDVLGGVWKGVDHSPTDAVVQFSTQLAGDSASLGALSRAVLEVLAFIGPPESAEAISALALRSTGTAPRWLPLLDNVALLEIVTSEDVFGDQTNYIMQFGYRDGGRVVGCHIIIAMVDHNLHLMKDAFIVEGPTFEQLTAVFNSDPDLYVLPVPDLAYVAGAITRAMDSTDLTVDVGELLGEETASTWYLLRSRVRRCLPAPRDAPKPHPAAERDKDRRAFLRAKVTKDFLATEVEGQLPDPQMVDLLAQLFIDFACDLRGRPEVWSPTTVEMFLCDFAPSVVWQADHIAWVAPTLRVFVEWAQKRRPVVIRGRHATQEAIDQFAGDFIHGARRAALGVAVAAQISEEQ